MEAAIERFVVVGETIADENPDIQPEMYDACQEARIAGRKAKYANFLRLFSQKAILNQFYSKNAIFDLKNAILKQFLSRAKRLKFGFAESPIVVLAVVGVAFARQ